jgi:hypothetical protein
VEEQRHLRVGVDGVSELQVLANGSEGSMAAQLAAPKRLGAHRGNDTELPGGKDAMFPGGAPISSSSSAFLLPCFFLSSRLTLFLQILAAAAWDGEETKAAVGFIARG